MNRLARLKTQILRNLIVPSSVKTLSFVTNHPEWQVKYAIESLIADRSAEPTGKLYKMCEPRSRARSLSK